MKVAILGAGSFGVALAVQMSRQGSNVVLWEYLPEHAYAMQKERISHHLPQITLPNQVSISSDMKEVLSGSEIVLIAVPSDTVEDTIEKAKLYLADQNIIVCSKGFGSGSRLLSEVISHLIPNRIFYLYGPTLALEMAKGELSAMVLAGGDGKEKIKEKIESENLIIELSDDIIGLQVGAALKNVVTIFVGIAEGAGLGQNTQAFIFTRGISDIQKIGIALGADSNTFIGLTCVGDLTLHSRNRNLGIELGRGRALAEILSEMDYVPEGVLTLKNAHALRLRLGVDVSTIENLYAIVFENKDIEKAVSDINTLE